MRVIAPQRGRWDRGGRRIAFTCRANRSIIRAAPAVSPIACSRRACATARLYASSSCSLVSNTSITYPFSQAHHGVWMNSYGVHFENPDSMTYARTLRVNSYVQIDRLNPEPMTCTRRVGTILAGQIDCSTSESMTHTHTLLADSSVRIGIGFPSRQAIDSLRWQLRPSARRRPRHTIISLD